MTEASKIADTGPAPTVTDRLSNGAFRAVMALALALPYRWRVPMTGWVVSRLLAPVLGYSRRVRENLALARPDLSADEVARLARAVPDNLGRTLAEIYSGQEFIDRVKDIVLEGPGAAALENARAAGRPVILATGHFGNYDVARAALIARGYPVGGLYKPMKNRLFDAHYVQAISRLGTPLFSRSNRGLAQMVRFLKSGGMLGIVSDQHVGRGAELSFFGLAAQTALSAAELALKYDALLVPIYGIRQPDGLGFKILVEAPVPAGRAEEMTQALNDSLEALVRTHMDQWFWVHRRWKKRR